MEFWSSNRIWSIAGEVGKPIKTGRFTDQLQKTGFARVKVEIDSTVPLKPGISIKGKSSML